jgi:purine-binding chemotaxis protein CheW
LLWCQVQHQTCVLPVEHACEVMRPLPLLKLEGLPSYVSGWAVVRGQPTPVVDLATLLGFPSAGRLPVGRFITIRGLRQPMPLALAVTDVLGIRQVTGDTWFGMLPLGRAMAPHVLSSIKAENGELLMVLDHARLLNEAAERALHHAMKDVDAAARGTPS